MVIWLIARGAMTDAGGAAPDVKYRFYRMLHGINAVGYLILNQGIYQLIDGAN